MAEAVSKGGRSGVVAIVGRPSAGKSTLLNVMCGHKVAIVSPVPQTTRNRIRGIVNRASGQLIFIDTPGFHDSERRFNRHMRGLIEETIRDSEALLYVVDAARLPGAEEHALIELVASHRDRTPVVVALNKQDIAPAVRLAEIRDELASALPGAPIEPVSGLTGSGVETVVERLFDLVPEGPPSYPQEYYTDQPPEFRIQEIIREQAIVRTRAEVPHSLYVDVADLEVRRDDADRELLWIRAFIQVERESQKGILVGKGGATIKAIRQAAQREIATVFTQRIHLDLRVKVDSNWRHKDQLLRRLVT